MRTSTSPKVVLPVSLAAALIAGLASAPAAAGHFMGGGGFHPAPMHGGGGGFRAVSPMRMGGSFHAAPQIRMVPRTEIVTRVPRAGYAGGFRNGGMGYRGSRRGGFDRYARGGPHSFGGIDRGYGSFGFHRDWHRAGYRHSEWRHCPRVWHYDHWSHRCW
jgi:hypothetical protein